MLLMSYIRKGKKMSKEAILIFQDCPDCGANKGWYDKQEEIARKKGIVIRKASFVEPGIKGLIIKAASQGIDRMPFFADNAKSPRRFSYNVADLFTEPKIPTEFAEVADKEPKPVKKTKRTRKAKKVEDGSISES